MKCGLQGLCVVLLSLLVARPVGAEDPKPEGGEEAALVSDAAWQRLGIEGKWVAVTRLLADKNTAAKEVLAFLASKREGQLLEWLAVYGGSRPALGELVTQDDPRWIRVALWGLEAADSHDADASRSKLLARDPARVMGYAQRFPRAKRAAGMTRLLENWGKQGVVGAPRATDLPPLEPSEVFRHLTPPAELGDLDLATPAAAQGADGPTRFRHQVIRALEGARRYRKRDTATLERMESLLDHADALVRQHAALAYIGLPPRQVPYDRLFEIYEALADHPGRQGEAEAAFQALARSGHPEVARIIVNRLDGDRPHVLNAELAASVALGDLHVVDRILSWRGVATGWRRALQQVTPWLESVQQMRRRLRSETPRDIATRMEADLERGAWFSLVEGSDANLRWHRSRIEGARSAPVVRKTLRRLATKYSFDKRYGGLRLPMTWRRKIEDVDELITRYVRAVARQLLDAK